MKVLTIVTSTALLGAAVLSGGCDSTAAPPPPTAASITLSAPSDSLDEGSTLLLAASVRDAAGQELPGRSVTWGSSDTTVIRVSPAGLATGVAPGRAIASATADGRTGSLSLSVKAAIATVAVSALAGTVEEGATLQLTVSVRDVRGQELPGKAVSWRSSDTTIARVSGTGLVTGIAPGTATVTANAGGRTGSLVVRVVAAVVASVRLTPASAGVLVGDTVLFTATPLSRAGVPLSGRRPRWSCDDVAVATVNSDGLAIGVAAGTALITASYGTASGSARIGIGCALQATVGFTAPPAYVPPTGAACAANDAASLRACVGQVRQGVVDRIRIDALIPCSGPDACFVHLGGITRPVTVYGSRPDYGLRRVDNYVYPLINAAQATDVTIANLTLDEGPDAPACDPVPSGQYYGFPCQASIQIGDAARTVLDGLTLLNSKLDAVSVNGAHGFVLRNSTIGNAGVNGIWVGAGSNLLFENDYVYDSRSNGIYLGHSDSATLRLSTIRHNNRVALFNGCNGLCAGPQVAIDNNTHLSIVSNEIVLGQIDLNNATGQVDGIEVSSGHSHVRIENNLIANNKDAGITVDPGAVLTSFVVSRNKVVNNGVAFQGFDVTPAVFRANCFTP